MTDLQQRKMRFESKVELMPTKKNDIQLWKIRFEFWPQLSPMQIHNLSKLKTPKLSPSMQKSNYKT